MEQGKGLASGHLDSLDGLRGIAIVAVFLHHIFGSQGNWSQITHTVVHGAIRLLQNGWMGVDLFFTLSGFLITTILLRARSADNYYSTFYMRRALRIFPLYYFAVVCTFLVRPIIFPNSTHIPGHVQVWYWFNLSNLRSAFFPGEVRVISHFWSLAIEEQFYLIWPLLVRKLRPRALMVLCILGIATEYGLRLQPTLIGLNRTYDDFFYRMTFTHSEGLFFGALLALLIQQNIVTGHHSRLFSACSVASMAGVILWIFHPTCPRWAGQLLFTLIAFGSACLIGRLVLAENSTRISRCLGNKWLVQTGRFSYCIYVVHVAVLVIATRAFSGRLPAFPGVHSIFQILLMSSFLVSFGLAAFSWRYFEEPILKLKDRFPYRTTQSAVVSRVAV